MCFANYVADDGVAGDEGPVWWAAEGDARSAEGVVVFRISSMMVDLLGCLG